MKAKRNTSPRTLIGESKGRKMNNEDNYILGKNPIPMNPNRKFKFKKRLQIFKKTKLTCKNA